MHVGDGYCDDEDNNEECKYDGGDCCDNRTPDWDNYCDDCFCLEPEKFVTPTTTTERPTRPTTKPSCEMQCIDIFNIQICIVDADCYEAEE